jgi:hypothetical protein
MTTTLLHRSRATLARLLLAMAAMSTGTPAIAHVWCVSTAADLRAKLVSAQANGEDDTIKLVRGTYAVDTDSFNFQSTETFGLVINGGFDIGCAQSAQDPRLTILDGGGAHPVFRSQSAGNLALRYLTLQNGRFDGGAGGGIQIFGTGPDSSVVLGVNILRNNVSNYAACVGFIQVEGTVHVNGNLIVDNHTPAAGGMSIDAGANAIAYVTNNTIANNTTGNATAGFLYVPGGNNTTPDAYFSNNIMWNNVAGSDVQFFGPGIQFNNNDIAVINGFQTAGSGANLSVDPVFASSSDFHLAATSPLLGIGLLAPDGGLPGVDLEGHPRTFAGLVDLGAYERGDEIFADGLE